MSVKPHCCCIYYVCKNHEHARASTVVHSYVCSPAQPCKSSASILQRNNLAASSPAVFTAQFSFNAGQSYTDTDVTTDQSTATGVQYITVDPNQGLCYELAAHMVRNTFTGNSSLDAVFNNYIGFYDSRGRCAQ